jgi:hypothetical protein
MKILENVVINLTAEDLRRRSTLDCSRRSAPRSSGIHLSGILRHLCYGPGGASPSKLVDPSNPHNFEEDYPLITAMGHMWEEFAASLYPEMIWQPGEVSRDSIYGTPDGMTYALPFAGDELMVNEEFKFTTKSVLSLTESADRVLGIPMFKWQGMGFCAMKGLNHVRWHVCWAHGDYRQNRWPIYTRTLVEFTDTEIENLWTKMIVPNKEKAIPE